MPPNEENFAELIEDIGGTPGSFNPVYVNSRGLLQRIPTGGILNIAGVSGQVFTVNGKGVLLADGSSSLPNEGTSAINLQSVYLNSPTADGKTVLRLEAGKDLVFTNPQNTVQLLTIDDFGKVTISGEEFSANSSVIKLIGAYQEAEHWNIVSSDGTRSSLNIVPAEGVVFSTNVVTIKSTSDGEVDFSINQSGETYIRNLTIGTLNGNSFDFDAITNLVNGLDDLTARFNAHVAPVVDVDVHQAGEISYSFSAAFPSPLDTAEDVHSALTILGYVVNAADTQYLDLNARLTALQASFDSFINTDDTEDTSVVAQVASLGLRVTALESGLTDAIADLTGQIAVVQNSIEQFNTIGIEYKQLIPSEAWIVSHNKNTSRIQFSVYDAHNRILMPDDAFVLDDNTFIIVFGAPQLGKAMLSCFVEPVESITNEDSDYSEPILFPDEPPYYL